MLVQLEVEMCYLENWQQWPGMGQQRTVVTNLL
jgi:hypothetical protein